MCNASSSICGVYELLLGESELAKHPWLAAVRGAAKIRNPLKSRYDDMWDPGMVVGHWATTPARDTATLRARALSLGALALYARPSDLERISRLPAHWQVLPDKFRFRIRGPKEAKNAAVLSPWIELPFLPPEALDDDNLNCCSCAGRAWKAYFDQLDADNVQHLPLQAQRYPHGRFLSLTPTPHRGIDGSFHQPLGSQRISNIIKGVMTDAGVDTSIFKGGSCRHAGSSEAATGGGDLLRIMSTGRWSSFKTFKKFYLRARITAEQRRAAAL